MPGGLTRVGAASDIPIVTMQRGGGKDTWVVSEGPVTAVSCWRRRGSASGGNASTPSS